MAKGDVCGPLQYSFYGTRDAAQNWEAELGNQMTKRGLHKGNASPSIYANQAIASSVRGDDITMTSRRKLVEDFINEFQTK